MESGDGSSDNKWTAGFIPQELIVMLCGDFTGCEEANDGDYFTTEADIIIHDLYEGYLDDI